MIVEIKILYDDIRRQRNGGLGRERDDLILLIDKAMGGATWESNGGNSWTARR